MKQILAPRTETVRDAGFGFGLLPWVRGPLWRTAEYYDFQVVETKLIIEIPPGFLYDKASIPPFFWGFPFNLPPSGLCELPALEHDRLCYLIEKGLINYLDCDGNLVILTPKLVHNHFAVRLRECGVTKTRAFLMGWAVKLFGPGSPLDIRPLVKLIHGIFTTAFRLVRRWL